MRILHYLSEIVLAHGGVVRAVLDLCQALASAGHEVELLTFDATDLPPAWRTGGPGLPRATVLEWPGLPKVIRQFRAPEMARVRESVWRAEVVHVHTPWEGTNLQVTRAARERGIPYVVSVHGMLDDWTIRQGYLKKRVFLSLLSRRVLDRAACVLCTADAERTQAARWFANPRVDVLPLIVDLEPFRSLADPVPGRSLVERRLGQASGSPIVLFLSRVHPKKGIEHLIDGAAELSKGGADFVLAVAGSGDEGYVRSLKDRVRARGIEDRTAFLGLVTGPEKLSLLRAARVMVLPTSQENWGFALIESLACGRPVVTTRAVDIWPELERSGGAMIVEQGAGAVASAVGGLLREPARADEMGERGRAWVMKELEPGAVLARYEAFYRRVIDDAR